MSRTDRLAVTAAVVHAASAVAAAAAAARHSPEPPSMLPPSGVPAWRTVAPGATAVDAVEVMRRIADGLVVATP